MLRQSGCTVSRYPRFAPYGAAHIPGSTHLSEQNLEQFIKETDSDTALIVMCYHGISSQSASAYLSSRGFTETYSLDGGFEAWRLGGE